MLKRVRKTNRTLLSAVAHCYSAAHAGAEKLLTAAAGRAHSDFTPMYLWDLFFTNLRFTREKWRERHLSRKLVK